MRKEELYDLEKRPLLMCKLSFHLLTQGQYFAMYCQLISFIFVKIGRTFNNEQLKGARQPICIDRFMLESRNLRSGLGLSSSTVKQLNNDFFYINESSALVKRKTRLYHIKWNEMLGAKSWARSQSEFVEGGGAVNHILI